MSSHDGHCSFQWETVRIFIINSIKSKSFSVLSFVVLNKMDHKIYWENSYQQVLSTGVHMKPTAMNKQVLIYIVYGLIQ